MEPLDEKELNQLLRRWDAPNAPPGLRDRVLPRRSGWRWVLTGSIRIPVPLGIAAVVILAIWIFSSRMAPRPVEQPAGSPTLADFQPVPWLEPKIVGKTNENSESERK
jgi:hypothetical protein